MLYYKILLVKIVVEVGIAILKTINVNNNFLSN